MAETRRTILERIDRNLIAFMSLFPAKLRLRFGTPETRGNLPQGPTHMAFTLKDNQHVAVTLEADDAAGNPTPFDFPTAPSWTSSDDTILTASANADGSNADISTTGKLGSAQITVSGVTTDGRTITGIGDVDVVTSAPTTFKLVFGTPADK